MSIRRDLFLPACIIALAASIGCASKGSKRFTDSNVEVIGTVDTPDGTAEVGKRKLMYTPWNQAPREITVYGWMKDRDASHWHEEAMAVPGYGLCGVDRREFSDSQESVTPKVMAWRIAPPRDGMKDLDLYSVERVIGADPLRPDMVLVRIDRFGDGIPDELVVFRKGAKPELLGNPVSLGSKYVFTETFSDLTIANLQEKDAVRTIFLGPDLRPVGDAPKDLKRFPIYDPTFKTFARWLPGAYVVPSPVGPAYFLALGPDGNFGAPTGSAGLLPILMTYHKTAYQYHTEPVQALTGWLVPQFTEDGLRWGAAKPDLSGWTGPLWKEVRLQAAPAMKAYCGRDVWLLAQHPDGSWDAIAPGPKLEIPSFRTPAGAETAFKNAEAHMNARRRESEEYFRKLRESAEEDMKRHSDRYENVRRAKEEQEKRDSFFGTENLIYGKSVMKLGDMKQWMEGEQRAAIEDMKKRGVYDAYGRPYDHLNRR